MKDGVLRQRKNEERRVFRRSTEAAERDGLFRNLLDEVDIGAATVSPSGEILYCNFWFLQLLDNPQVSRARTGEIKLANLVTPAGQRDLEHALAQATLGRVEAQLQVDSEAGKTRTIRLSMMPVWSDTGLTIGIIATEVTELMERTKELQKTEQSVEYLSARIMSVQDEERRRLARDLHDVTGQELAVIGIGLKRIGESFEKPGFNMIEALEEQAELVRKVGDEVRTLSYLLHPPLLDDFGLEPAVRWYCDGFKKRSGIDVEVQHAGKLPRLSPDKETALFRVVQESLTNVYRHSGAKRAEVRLRIAGEELQVCVKDCGKGMQARAAGAVGGRPPMFGVGIRGMQERLQQLNGRLEVQSDANGTTVIATLPVDHDQREATLAEPAASREQGAGQAGALRRGLGKRVLIVDDHDVVRRGIRTLLEREPDLEVCGEAADGLEALAKVRELKPDVMILDLTMPRVGGLTVAKKMHENEDMRKTKILVFTTHASSEIEKTARIFHCDGYVVKSNASQDLVRGLRAVLAGDQFFGAKAEKAQSA